MRTANFRDDVLWAIAYKLGLTPGVDFLKDQAASLASYINAWVRRLWDGADWPEWTVIGRFAPTSSRIVGWNNPPIDYSGFPTPGGDEGDFPGPAPAPPMLGKVLRVYIVDPRTTWTPVDTPFRLYNSGVHCGFEHGNSVWIKYLPRAPEFTSDEWDNDLTYNKDEKVYSPVSGHCFVSKSNNNLGHDPNETAESEEPDSMSVEIMQKFEPGSPGLGGLTEIVEVVAQDSPGSGDYPVATLPLDDPPPVGREFTVAVTDEPGTTTLGDAIVTGDGVKTLDTLWGELATALTAEPGLSAFTISKLATDPVRLKLQAGSGFKVKATYNVGGVAVYPLFVQQIQAYVPPTSGKSPVSKMLKLVISEQQVIPGATYKLVFTSLDSQQHTVAYVSLSTDDAVQILDGIIKTMIGLQGADPFFAGIESTLEASSAPSAMFTVAPTIAKVSLDALIIPPGSIWWAKVLFPRALVDQVVRGAYADALKEEGQPDKGMPEEQQVPNEQTIRTAGFASKQYDGLTDQVIQRSRYSKQ